MRFLRRGFKNDVVTNESSSGTGGAATVSSLDECFEFDAGSISDESDYFFFDGETALDPFRPPESTVGEKSERRYGAVDRYSVRK